MNRRTIYRLEHGLTHPRDRTIYLLLYVGFSWETGKAWVSRNVSLLRIASLQAYAIDVDDIEQAYWDWTVKCTGEFPETYLLNRVRRAFKGGD